MENKDLVGKRFKYIKDSDVGGIEIGFLDGSIAQFEVYTYPDGTVSCIERDSISEGLNNES